MNWTRSRIIVLDREWRIPPAKWPLIERYGADIRLPDLGEEIAQCRHQGHCMTPAWLVASLGAVEDVDQGQKSESANFFCTSFLSTLTSLLGGFSLINFWILLFLSSILWIAREFSTWRVTRFWSLSRPFLPSAFRSFLENKRSILHMERVSFEFGFELHCKLKMPNKPYNEPSRGS